MTERLNFKHPTGHRMIECFIDGSAILGARSVVWDYARVLADVVIGEDCSIGGGAEIGRGTTIGNRSRISANVFLPSNTRIGREVFLGPGVICTDDRFPKTLAHDEVYTAEPPTIEDGASVGAGSILLPGVRIGIGARVAAGSLVAHDVPDYGVVLGRPAREYEPSRSW